MKRLLLFTFMVLLVLPLSAQKRYDEIEYPEMNPINMPEVEEFTLDNGVTFFLVEDHELPLINVRATIRTGELLEPASKAGLASITGDVIREGGSENYPADELNALLENRAANMSTFIGFNSGSAQLNVLKEDFDDLLPVFVDVLQNPAFPEDKIELAKTQTKSAISRRNDEQSQVGFREFSNLIYGDNSVYTRQTEYATVDNITREDMVDFHDNYFVANNMTVGIIGDFDTDEMKQKLREAFGSLPAGKETNMVFPEVDYEYPSTINFVNKENVNQSFVVLGHIGGLRENPDYPALQVMNEVLAGGFSGRLFQEVRTNLGLAYSVGGSYGANVNYPGVFRLITMTKSSTTAEAIDAILKEVKRLQEEPITQEELELTKDQFLNSLVFRYDSKSKILNERIDNEYLGLSPDAFDELVEGIKATTIEDVQRVAREYLKPEQVQILVVGNEDEIGDQLQKYGNVNKVDISIPEPPSDEEEVAGDAAQGGEWLEKMADAVIEPGTDMGPIFVESVITQQTQMGPMEITSTAITNYDDYSSERTMQTPQGEIQMKIENGGGTMSMMGQERPLPPQMATPVTNEMKRNYIAIALNKDELEAEYLGSETVDGEELEVIRIKGDVTVTYLLDAESGLPARARYSEMNPQTGQRSQAESVFSDWEVVDGVALAYTTVTYVDGEEAATQKVESHSIED
ncbi:insulinase family protein [Gracilimonas mengyeensis]|uniref:Predicted Zn-dependent peptidase n=1 Tax=Gracilimonas mengyeensis TaxID=1302730 RepID=A0A521F6F5_9BACT|nr:insulinase family protein [Gracilimonas mengyeensis]SMO91788.1 Predicted Zn-dependent peptidase [Gracilimonas mengyeensis]